VVLAVGAPVPVVGAPVLSVLPESVTWAEGAQAARAAIAGISTQYNVKPETRLGTLFVI
jgi:hypothetical protein